MPKRAKTEEEWITKILSNITKKENGCWEFNGRKNNGGYGSICFGGEKIKKDLMVHKLVYKHMKGDIPKGLCVCHSCDNPPCCNPEHLFLGTNEDNIKDSVSKNRHSMYKKYGEKTPYHKLTSKQVEEILQDGRPYKEIIKDYGVVKSTISSIKNRHHRIYG